jgi:hypothetical protein
MWRSAVSVSLVTSTLVTLLIEYIAKPSLEARKERILESRRARRKLVGLLADILIVAGGLSADAASGMTPEQRRIFEGRLREAKPRIVECGKEVTQVLVTIGAELSKDERRAVSLFSGYVRGVGLSEQLRTEISHDLLLATSPMMDYFAARRLGRICRRRHLRHALSVLAPERAHAALSR